ncbi:MAG: MFS transporter [Chloroflexi bacterium]|nr:MFS transporter [Chloroflexota bacterium]MBS58218.1 MFS transporter [Chloroflexota bacterium]|tara:strand:+ start:96 stop:1334 length:1239 start_codon:yes stop_codon:yes gene_type:complete
MTHHHDKNHETGIRGQKNFIIAGLTSGHGVFHWFTQSFFVLLPEVEQAFGLSKVGVGAITTTREIASGIITLPGGIIADSLKKHWGLILALCMGFFGIGWLIIGQAPVFPLLLVGVAIIAIAASLWHLPAMASLSHHFSHRRGTALSFHGIGGNIGDAISPVVTGFLLGYLAWREILSIYAVVPIFIAFLVFWAFRNIGKTNEHKDSGDKISQKEQTRKALKNPALWAITFIGGIRGMAFIALMTFLPSYFSSDLEMSDLARGAHFGLLVAIGIISTPIMGYLSDKIGRKRILVPGMIFLSIIVILMSFFGEGITLILLIALLGTFFYSDQPILTASALDIVGEGVATTTLGTLSFSRFILSAISPLIAGFLYDSFSMNYVFYYVAFLMIIGAILLYFVPLKNPHHEATHHH